MINVHTKKIALITTFLFIFLMAVNTVPLQSVDENKGKTLMENGKKHYLNGDFQAAIDVWLQAAPLIKEKQKLPDLYLYISFANFKLGQTSRAEDFLRKMFEIQPRKNLNESDYDTNFLVIYNKIKAEYWFNFRVESKEDQETQQKIIEKLSIKPKKKKKKILPLLIIGFLVITVAVVTIILSTKKKEENYGILIVRNLTDDSVFVRFENIDRIVGIFNYAKFFLLEGTYNVELYDYSDHSRMHSVTIIKNETSYISFLGWSE